MNEEQEDVLVVLEDEKALLLDHEADGIKELDNKLPRWWLWLFYISIAFSAVYMVYFHMTDTGTSHLQVGRYDREMANAQAAAEARQATAPEGAEAAAPAEPSTDEAVLAQGQKVYTTHCFACHLGEGQGLVGPNLCDDYWIHGGAYADTVHLINEGVPAKGMITWKTVLSADDIQAVASYLYTLRGTDPPNPKAPEGEEYTP